MNFEVQKGEVQAKYIKIDELIEAQVTYTQDEQRAS